IRVGPDGDPCSVIGVLPQPDSHRLVRWYHRLMVQKPPLGVVLATTVLLTACSGSATRPSDVSSLTIGAPSPGPGSSISTVLRGFQYFVDRGSGALSIPITVTSGREVPYAALWVYLGTGPEVQDYCGQNLPDAPTWGPFAKGQTVSVAITAFQIFRVPCTVT